MTGLEPAASGVTGERLQKQNQDRFQVSATNNVAQERTQLELHCLRQTESVDQFSNIAVRETCSSHSGHQGPTDPPSPPAHPLDRLVAQLNANWQVVNDPLQWILQRRKGNSRTKSSGWRNRSFFRTRPALLRCIRDYCGHVDADALAKVSTLPPLHHDDECCAR